MKKLLGLLAASSCLLGAGTASALPETLVDIEEVDEWVTTWETVQWTHRFAFNPVAESIISATLTLSFWDDERDTRRLSSQEFAIGGIVGSWELALGEIDGINQAFNVNVGQVADGVLGVWVTSLFGDFGIGNSRLEIAYNSATTPPVSVPEPETLALLGFALLGLGFARRRMQARA